jgi:choline dehydrogenase
MLREGVKFVRKLGQTPPFNNSLGAELSPGSAVVNDSDIDAWVIPQANTQYHPIGTCSMLPRNQSGVVNAKLRVYGTCTSGLNGSFPLPPADI